MVFREDLTTTADEKEVLKISSEKFRYMLDADIVQLDRILDSNFTLTHITGHVGSRNEWLTDLKSKRFIYHSIDPKNFDTKKNGAALVVTSKAIIDATIYGGRGTYSLQLIETYERKSDSWKLMKMVASTY